MSKKNSSVILKNSFKDFSDLNKVYLKFKKKLNILKKKSLVVAISGGPDSLALAALSKAYSYEKKTKFYYVLVNHNIRRNSTSEAKRVANLLKKHQINLKVISNHLPIKKNIQGNARKIRYELLTKFCLRKKIRSILTAHNLEDQVETFLIRLSRGSGLTGLSAMNYSTLLSNNICLFRPLLDTKKNVLIKICKISFGKYLKDPSNIDPKYLRTKIRNLKNPLIKSGISYDQIIKSINNLASSKATLEVFYQKVFKDTVKKSNKEITLNLKKFNKFNNEIKMKIINDSIKILKKNYYNPRSKKVQNLIKMIKLRDFNKSTLGGCLFYIKKDHLCIKIEKM